MCFKPSEVDSRRSRTASTRSDLTQAAGVILNLFVKPTNKGSGTHRRELSKGLDIELYSPRFAMAHCRQISESRFRDFLLLT